MISPVKSKLSTATQAAPPFHKVQSKLYHATRWAFLSGRKGLIHELPFAQDAEISILEIGCETGQNIKHFANYFENAQITGLETSSGLLNIAAKNTQNYDKRVQLRNVSYTPSLFNGQTKFDIILCAYILSSVNPNWDKVINQAYRDLKPGGMIAVIDFHDSKFNLFKRHMNNNHVEMEGHLLNYLNKKFASVSEDVHQAYLGIWEYFSFVGIKPYSPMFR
jgi:S-adenosylmethionine-diacylgycerolhomoserine-N-methlytransferase